MRRLKCKSIARNIPLYVAGDLAGKSEREVAVHLGACEDCRRLSEEFSESSSLLMRACSAPEFGPEVYTSIRSAVLADIGSRRSRPALFRHRWFYATAFAAVLITSGLTLQYFSSARRQAATGVALAPPVTNQPRSHQAKGTSAQPHERSPLLPVPVSRAIARVRRSAASDTAQTVSINRAQAAPAIALPANSRPVTPGSAADGSALPTSARGWSPQIARIEIQTANPNIRIIWLAPPEPRESDETNRDQDQHQNGTRK
jgi:hypothetical protein